MPETAPSQTTSDQLSINKLRHSHKKFLFLFVFCLFSVTLLLLFRITRTSFAVPTIEIKNLSDKSDYLTLTSYGKEVFSELINRLGNERHIKIRKVIISIGPAEFKYRSAWKASDGSLADTGGYSSQLLETNTPNNQEEIQIKDLQIDTYVFKQAIEAADWEVSQTSKQYDEYIASAIIRALAPQKSDQEISELILEYFSRNDSTTFLTQYYD